MIHAIEANLAGKTALVTGANTGIGKEIARDLARLNARVLLACRSEERGRAGIGQPGKPPQTVQEPQMFSCHELFFHFRRLASTKDKPR